MKPTLSIIAGIVAVLVGLGFVMPAVAQWRTQGALEAFEVPLLVLGLALTFGGAAFAFRGIKHRGN